MDKDSRSHTSDSAKRPERRINSNISRNSDNTVLTEGHYKCPKHNKVYEAIYEDTLMCIDWVKHSDKKTEKLQISDLSLMINDKMIENIEVLEQYQTIFSKEISIQDLLRKFFKSMHEILYEIENSK